jgi:carboxylesterase type B
MGQSISTDHCSPYVLEISGKGIFKGTSLISSRTGKATAHRFCKVPYAYPIEGNLRFTLPKELPDDFDYTGDYTEFGLKCPQPAVENPHFRYFKSPSEEAIQYSNIWVPASTKYKPKEGWPVLIYIHGGWLQYNTPNSDYFNISEMLDDDEFQEKFILVTPGYRLNIFGFLSSKELLKENSKNSNFGFWDQRMAIEWTYKNIKFFGGNPEKITVGGISAGSYSTFFQLAYEIYNPDVLKIIKQCAFFSNMVYIQPKTIEETQEQFDEIIDKLSLDKTLLSNKKLAKLRELDTNFIEDFIPSLTFHTFRAVTDENFISSQLIKDLHTGKFGRLLKDKGIRILNGEVDNECFKYSLLNTPETVEELGTQIENYYPRIVIPTLLELYDATPEAFAKISKDRLKEQLRIKYGAIIGEGQVYASSRGFINKIVENGFPHKDIFRYRISFRAKWLDEHLKKVWKVPHGGDVSVWFYNLRKGYNEEERNALNIWLYPYIKFLNFENNIEDWPTIDIKKIRNFKTDGTVEYIEDKDWDWGIKVTNAIYKTQFEALIS